MKKLMLMLVLFTTISMAVAQLPTTMIKGTINDTVVFTGCLEIPVDELVYQIANSREFEYEEDMCRYDTILKHISSTELSTETIFLTPDGGHTLFCLQKNQWGELSKIWLRFLDEDFQSDWYYADKLIINLGINVKDIKTNKVYNSKFLLTDFSQPKMYIASETLIEVFFDNSRIVIPRGNWKAAKIVQDKKIYKMTNPELLLLYKWIWDLPITL